MVYPVSVYFLSSMSSRFTIGLAEEISPLIPSPSGRGLDHMERPAPWS